MPFGKSFTQGSSRPAASPSSTPASDSQNEPQIFSARPNLENSKSGKQQVNSGDSSASSASKPAQKATFALNIKDTKEGKDEIPVEDEDEPKTGEKGDSKSSTMSRSAPSSPRSKKVDTSAKEHVDNSDNTNTTETETESKRANLIKRVSGKLRKLKRELSSGGKLGGSSSQLSSSSSNASSNPSSSSSTNNSTSTTSNTDSSTSQGTSPSTAETPKKQPERKTTQSPNAGRLPRTSRGVLNSLKKLTNPLTSPRKQTSANNSSNQAGSSSNTPNTTPSKKKADEDEGEEVEEEDEQDNEATPPKEAAPKPSATPTSPSSTSTHSTPTSVPAASPAPSTPSTTPPTSGVCFMSPALSPLFWVGAHSDPGARYGNVNQDSYLYCKSGPFCHIVSVCDGHGINGEIASKIAITTFKEFFESHPMSSSPSSPPSSPRSASGQSAAVKKERMALIESAFQSAHDKIVEEYPKLESITYNDAIFKLENIKGLSMYKNSSQGVLLQDFGTTATVVAIFTRPPKNSSSQRERIEDVIIAYSGDSPVIIGKEDKKGHGLIAVADLCTPHNGENQVEEERVKKFGSTIAGGAYIAPPAESGFAFAQLAVTRALGHRYFSKYGVIPQPEFAQYSIDLGSHHDDDTDSNEEEVVGGGGDRYIIVTSDGVSDVLAPAAICDHFKQWRKKSKTAFDLNEAAKKLVMTSVETWNQLNPNPESKSEMADNTTAIIVDLKRIGKLDKKT